MKTEILMTTYNRLDLLEKCVKSIVNSDYCPKGIRIYDDCSKDVEKVKSIIRMFPNPIFNKNEFRIGCDGNTPVSIGKIFSTVKDCEYVLVIDSDMIVTKNWWSHIKRYIYTLENDNSIAAIQSLNLDNIFGKKVNKKYSDLMECDKLSACGLIVSRKYYQEYVLQYAKAHWWAWDVQSSEKATACGMKCYCARESAFQHIGDTDGTHSGAGQVSSTFYGAVNENIISDRIKEIIFISGENFRDVALSIMAATIASKKGYRSTILNMNQKWCEFIKYIVGDKINVISTRITTPIIGKAYNIKEEVLNQIYPEYITTCNIETEADENKWIVYSSNGSPEQYINNKLNSIGIKTDDSEYDWNILIKPDKLTEVSYNGFSINETLIINDYDNDIDLIKKETDPLCGKIKILKRERPNNGTWKKCIFNKTPTEIVKTINTAGKFVSVLNKSSYMSLFCNCETKIYDCNEFNKMKLPQRVDVYNNISSKLSVCILNNAERDEYFNRYALSFDIFNNKLDYDQNKNKYEWGIVINDKSVCGYYYDWIADLLNETNSDVIQATNIDYPSLNEGFVTAYKTNSLVSKSYVSKSCRLSSKIA